MRARICSYLPAKVFRVCAHDTLRIVCIFSSNLPLHVVRLVASLRRPTDSEFATEQVSQSSYAEVLRDSALTLSPAGGNPECFRLFEAIEAGSVPVVTREDLLEPKYFRGMGRPHPCGDALAHWRDAPMLVLDSWDDLFSEVERLRNDPEELDGMQRKMREWYVRYMRKVVREFEDFMAAYPGPSAAAIKSE